MPVVTRSQSKMMREKVFSRNTIVISAGYKEYPEFCKTASRLSTSPAFTNTDTQPCVRGNMLYTYACSLRANAKHAIAYMEQYRDPSMLVYVFNRVNHLMCELKMREAQYHDVDDEMRAHYMLSLDVLEAEVNKLSKELSNGLLRMSDSVMFSKTSIMGYKLAEKKFCKADKYM
jgi:hypothetical protein